MLEDPNPLRWQLVDIEFYCLSICKVSRASDHYGQGNVGLGDHRQQVKQIEELLFFL
jgi:hypothetical protein